MRFTKFNIPRQNLVDNGPAEREYCSEGFEMLLSYKHELNTSGGNRERGQRRVR
jgi:hypothetical protein